jgi:hypothetical protein
MHHLRKWSFNADVKYHLFWIYLNLSIRVGGSIRVCPITGPDCGNNTKCGWLPWFYYFLSDLLPNRHPVHELRDAFWYDLCPIALTTFLKIIIIMGSSYIAHFTNALTSFTVMVSGGLYGLYIIKVQWQPTSLQSWGISILVYLLVGWWWQLK